MRAILHNKNYITKMIMKPKYLGYTSVRYFGGGGHEVQHVHLDPNTTYIANHDVNNEFVALNGFTDINDHSHHEHVDPYKHIKNKPFFSFERMYFSDPYHALDDEEPLMNEPHGYLLGDDPLDVRNSIERSIPEYMAYAMIAIGIGLFLGYQTIGLVHPSLKLYQMNLTAGMIEDEIKKIRVENKQLEDRRDELLKQLEDK